MLLHVFEVFLLVENFVKSEGALQVLAADFPSL